MKLPPFGKILHARLSEGNIPTNDVYIFIGHRAWQEARERQLNKPGTLCLPPWQSGITYHWPVAFCDILLFDTGHAEDEYVEDLVFCLMAHGANIVRYIDVWNKLFIFKKEF